MKKKQQQKEKKKKNPKHECFIQSSRAYGLWIVMKRICFGGPVIMQQQLQ